MASDISAAGRFGNRESADRTYSMVSAQTDNDSGGNRKRLLSCTMDTETPVRTRAGTIQCESLEHSLMMTNLSKEENIDVEDTAHYTYQKGSLNSWAKKDKMLKYDHHQVTNLSALFIVTGTVFSRWSLYRKMFVYWLVSFSVVLVDLFSDHYSSDGNLVGKLRAKLFPRSSEEHVEAVQQISSYLATVLGFLLGMYVSTMVGRWWAIRNNTLGTLWGCIDDLGLILSYHMRDEKDRVYKERFLRLGLLSHRLVCLQARREDDEENLRQLIEVGLLTEEEMQVLLHSTPDAKPQAIWVWIGSLFHLLAEKGKLKYPQYLMPQLDLYCAKARGGIGGTFAYLDTQVPYQWIHLLSITIVFLNVLVALKVGFRLSAMVNSELTPDVVKVFVEVAHVSLVPFCYHAFLTLGASLGNPFGYDFMSFPEYSSHIYMRNNSLNFFKAGEQMPKSVLASHDNPVGFS